MTEVGEAALAYATAGYAVFPLRGKQPFGNCPACEPRSPRYRPHQAPDCRHELCHGLYAPTTDPGRVGRWWGEVPQANIGARVPANPLVVDLDPRHGGLGRLAELEREHGPLPATRVSISGRGDGGQHRWFLHPGGRLSATLRSAVVLAGRAIFVPFRDGKDGVTRVDRWGHGGATSGPRTTGPQRTTSVTVGLSSAQLTDQAEADVAGRRDAPRLPDTEEAGGASPI
jgi:hypothetical protein